MPPLYSSGHTYLDETGRVGQLSDRVIYTTNVNKSYKDSKTKCTKAGHENPETDQQVETNKGTCAPDQGSGATFGVLGYPNHKRSIERFHSRGQHTCRFTETKESVCIRKELNSHRTGLVHQHGRRFIVLEHQYGCRDVM